MTDNQDNPGINLPPPLICAVPLVWGCFSVKGAPPSCRCGAGPRVAALRRRGGAQWVVPKDDARRRSADTYRQAGAEAYYNRPVPLHPQPRLSRSGGDLLWDRLSAQLAVGNATVAVVITTVIQREVIGREERYLERTFGEEYLDYKGKVRRWI